jgi:6-phosphogluconolactonase
MALSRAAVAAVATTLAVGTASAGEYWVFFGTYTSKDGSQGIYRSKFDDATGKLTEPELAAEMASPSFVNIHPNNKFLYAVGEGGGKDGGPVVAFAIDGKTGELTKLNSMLSGGAGPCHISVSSNGKFAAVANYGGGSMSVYMLGDDGKLAKTVGFVQHTGSSTNKSRQAAPHAHCCFFDPTNTYVLTADLGIDKIKVLKVDADGGEIESDPDRDIDTPPGSGPRHLAIAPDGKCVYVCGELTSTVHVIEFGGKRGKVMQSLSTLPKPTPGNSTAECIMHPNGKFVYVSNRGHNSIAVFNVNDNRRLTAAGHITGDINIPRNFNIDPSGKWMLIASQDGGKVGVWELDDKGMGKETANTVAISRCVCIKFVPVAK